MSRRVQLHGRRLTIILSLTFLMLLSTVTAARAAWHTTCGTADACIWKNANFSVPRAANDISDSQYNNNNYPNTQDSLNDSAFSIENRFSAKDVVYFFNASYSSTSFCLKSGWSSGDLNSHNDEYSSHIIAVGSTC